MKDTRQTAPRALALLTALLLAALLPLRSDALFGKGESAKDAPAQGAPIAQNMEIKAYRGVAYTGTLKAADNADGELAFRLLTLPAKGTLEFGEEGVFVYTPDKNAAGGDSFTFAAVDGSGRASAPATVKIRIARVSSGVDYADTEGRDCATAAVDLAEHGVFVGARFGDDWFFEPERPVSRGEFVAMAMKAAGIAESEVTVTGFADDDAIPTWAKGSVAGALAAGVVRGSQTPEGVVFRAQNDVTVSEAAAVLNRVLKVTDVEPAELDADGSEWYAQAVANLSSVSIAPAGGFSGDSLSRSVTRGEAAQLLSAAMALREAREESQSVWGKIFAK